MSIVKYIANDPKGNPSIYIENMRASPQKSGTALLREVMVKSFKKPGIEGRVFLMAAWGSQLFHLKRGFCPVEGKFVVMPQMYGRDSELAVRCFIKRVAYDESSLKRVFAAEFNLEPDKITSEYLEESHPMFQIGPFEEIDCFAYGLANSIQQYRQRAQVPESNLFKHLKEDSENIRAVTMMMTPEGRERWKTAIDTGAEFKSFRDLSHLFKRIKRPYVKTLLIRAMTGMPCFELPSAQIRVKCPLAHSLTIRGEGADLDWAQGKPLQKSEDGTFVYRILGLTQIVAYKILLDDAQWETGDGHQIEAGQTQEFTPHF